MKRFLLIFAVILAALSCGRNGRPLVGISCNFLEPGIDFSYENYSNAILKAGGIPVNIPTLSTEEQARDLLSRLDAIILSGGEDVPPSWYGEEIWNETVVLQPIRDRSDSLLGRAALASGKPILGICRGGQLLNVLLGGNMYQDIPSQVAGAHTHRGVNHSIGLEKGSFLDKIFGADSLTVNSTHRQAAKDLAPGVKLAALSDDGIVEAWENGQVWSVQFHPEAMLAEDDRMLPLFEAFIHRLR